MKYKVRELLVRKGLVESEERGVALVLAGKVRVNGVPLKSGGEMIDEEIHLEVDQPKKFASRGGTKLAHALEHFKIEVQGRVCADVGSSTGGFTDVLLQRGAGKVYAIDVGYGELAWKLRSDPRVVLMERTNVREVVHLPEAVSFVCVDVSFISLQVVLAAIVGWFDQEQRKGVDLITLIKPQFEAPRDKVEAGGLVTDPTVHREVVEKVLSAAQGIGLFPWALVASPILGVHGNREFFSHLRFEVAPQWFLPPSL